MHINQDNFLRYTSRTYVVHIIFSFPSRPRLLFCDRHQSEAFLSSSLALSLPGRNPEIRRLGGGQRRHCEAGRGRPIDRSVLSASNCPSLARSLALLLKSSGFLSHEGREGGRRKRIRVCEEERERERERERELDGARKAWALGPIECLDRFGILAGDGDSS